MLKAVYSGSYCTHQCICQLWPCQTAWNEIFIPGIKGRWWMFHRHSAKFLIRERASQESRHFRSPFVLHEKKKHPTTLLGPLSTETVRNGGFLFAWEKVTWGWCHYVHPQVGPNMNFSRRCASLWRKAAKCYFVLVLSSCGLFQKSHLVTGFFSQQFLRCVKILHGCTSHTFQAKHTTRILSNRIQDPVQADSKNKFWESCNKNCWVISWYQLRSKPSPSLKDSCPNSCQK